jgi:DNA-binding NtrC family response regulator
MPFTLLIIRDEKQRFSPEPTQGGGDLHIHFAGSPEEAEARFPGRPVDLVLFSRDSGDDGMLDRVTRCTEKTRGAKILVFNTSDELNDTLASLRQHTSDVLKTLFSPPKPPSSDERMDGASLSCRHQQYRSFIYEGLIGNSGETQKLKELVVRIAPTNTTVLIQGESGTGKEVIARAIHCHSSRRSEVFMPVDCAAINESVIESELFGHTKGAFTGADWNTLGLIRSADRGTLFLDEIAELPLHLQAKLLRTLQEKAVKPVGSSKIFPVDIRIISATNCNLAEAVKKGTFRQDLYYRLSTVTIYSPPLRERLSDLPLLSSHFLGQMASEGFNEKKLSGDALAALYDYAWPGNIRELENVIRSSAAFSAGSIIEEEDLPLPVKGSRGNGGMVNTEPSSIAFHEREAIRKALEQTIGNRRAAARLLGISEATLYRRLKLYCI